MAAGAAAIIRFFGPESIGGVGDIGARIDAEVARTGLSVDEIGHKVRIFRIIFLDRLISSLVLKDIHPYRRKTGSDFWPSFNV